MSQLLEPREVEKPCVVRWLRTTAQLFLRSPLRFGFVIALIGFLDTQAVALARGYVVEPVWTDRIGRVLLPVLWALISAIARGADHPGQTLPALRALLTRPVLQGSFGVGLIWAVGNWALDSLIQTPASASAHALLRPGELADSLVAGALLISIWAGSCYFPLLTLTSGLSVRMALALSEKATQLNGRFAIWGIFAATAIISGGMAKLAPAFGMTQAFFLIFWGVLNYVVYRDIFERKTENEPAKAPVAQIAPALQSEA